MWTCDRPKFLARLRTVLTPLRTATSFLACWTPLILQFNSRSGKSWPILKYVLGFLLWCCRTCLPIDDLNTMKTFSLSSLTLLVGQQEKYLLVLKSTAVTCVIFLEWAYGQIISEKDRYVTAGCQKLTVTFLQWMIDVSWNEVALVMNPKSTGARWPVFNEREATTVNHSVKQYIDESFPTSQERSGLSWGIFCALESGHPEEQIK